MTGIDSAAAASFPTMTRRSPVCVPLVARLCRQVFLLVAIAASSRAPPLAEGAVEVQVPSVDDGTYVYHESRARSSTYEEFYRGPDENGTAFVVRSDVPVSILRYNDDMYLYGETPINRGDVYVVVKGNCSRQGIVDVEGTEFGVNVTYGNDTFSEGDRRQHDDGVSSVDVSVSPYDPSYPFAFLGASTFFASWQFFGGWLPPEGVDCPEGVSGTSRGSGGGSGAAATGLSARRAIGTVLAAATSVFLLFFSRDCGVVIGAGRGRSIAALTVVLAVALSFASEYQHQKHQWGDGTGGSPVTINRVTQAVEGEDGATSSPLENCVVNVEVLVDGCAQPLRVSAPAVRVVEVAILDQQESWPSSVPGCGPSQHTALLTFPDENVSVDVSAADSTEEDVSGVDTIDLSIPRLSEDVCMRAVPGRPFLESSNGNKPGGAPIQTAARFIDASSGDDSAEWSRRAQPSRSHNANDDPKVVPTEGVGSSSSLAADTSLRDKWEGEGAKQPSVADADAWVSRGLGEHASVASFAVHAIALMSNGAPPGLVRGALRAALDEVDHAEASFGAATELMMATGAAGGSVAVEPGPLPPTNHAFGRDLVGLALSTAREGCVDETLSALEAAHEADDGASLDAGLRLTLEKIALDEARHSALAWRTLGWACGAEPAACDAVAGEVFGEGRDSGAAGGESGLDVAATKRGYPSDGAVATAWHKIHRALVPVVLVADRGGEDDWTVECDDINFEDTFLVERSVVALVVKAIIRGVLCASGTESAASEYTAGHFLPSDDLLRNHGYACRI